MIKSTSGYCMCVCIYKVILHRRMCGCRGHKYKYTAHRVEFTRAITQKPKPKMFIAFSNIIIINEQSIYERRSCTHVAHTHTHIKNYKNKYNLCVQS